MSSIRKRLIKHALRKQIISDLIMTETQEQDVQRYIDTMISKGWTLNQIEEYLSYAESREFYKTVDDITYYVSIEPSGFDTDTDSLYEEPVFYGMFAINNSTDEEYLVNDLKIENASLDEIASMSHEVFSEIKEKLSDSGLKQRSAKINRLIKRK